MLYLDSSAIVKLVAPEPETAGLVQTLRSDPDAISSALAQVEVTRAVMRAGATRERASRAAAVLERIALVPIEAGILGRAAELPPPDLRTLDAIHLATALLLRPDIAGLITYDGWLAGAAAAAGIAVLTPS
jgi:predicted nucleic acid-binding protein